MHKTAANTLSAWALLVADAGTAAIDAEVGLDVRALSALVLIRNRPGCSVDWLHGEIGLTQSGAVRLVDRLQQQGLVSRGRELGEREVRLSVTAAGEARAVRGARARAGAIQRLIAPLSDREGEQLVSLVARALAWAPRDRDDADVACRLCDWDRCGADCPLDAAVARGAGD